MYWLSMTRIMWRYGCTPSSHWLYPNIHYGDNKWPSWRLELPVNRVFVQHVVWTDNKEMSKTLLLTFFRGIHRWLVDSPSKDSNVEYVSIWWRHNVYGRVMSILLSTFGPLSEILNHFYVLNIYILVICQHGLYVWWHLWNMIMIERVKWFFQNRSITKKWTHVVVPITSCLSTAMVWHTLRCHTIYHAFGGIFLATGLAHYWIRNSVCSNQVRVTGLYKLLRNW